jgi:hypothetical protein
MPFLTFKCLVCPVPHACSSCLPVPLSRLSIRACPAPPVISCLACSACIILLSCPTCPVTPAPCHTFPGPALTPLVLPALFLPALSCPAYSVLPDMFYPFCPFLLFLSCPACPVPALFYPSCPARPVPSALSPHPEPLACDSLTEREG